MKLKSYWQLLKQIRDIEHGEHGSRTPLLKETSDSEIEEV